MSQVQLDVLRCPYCHDTLAGEVARAGCGSCLAWHHRSCLAELGSCANCGTPSGLAASTRELEAAMGRVLARTCQVQGCRSIDTIPVRGTQICLPHSNIAPRAQRVVSVFLFCISAIPLVPLGLGEINRTSEFAITLAWVGGFFLLGWLMERVRREQLSLVAEAKRARKQRLARERAQPAVSRSPGSRSPGSRGPGSRGRGSRARIKA